MALDSSRLNGKHTTRRDATRPNQVASLMSHVSLGTNSRAPDVNRDETFSKDAGSNAASVNAHIPTHRRSMAGR